MAGASRSRSRGFWPLALVCALYVLFLYGPVITIFVLSLQGPEGGLTFPMRGASLHWYRQLWEGLGVVMLFIVALNRLVDLRKEL